MGKSKKILSVIALAVLSLLFLSCSSEIKKADIPNTANPQQEVTKFESNLNDAVAKNIDVLASKEFKKAVKWKDEAKSDLASHEKQEEILDDVRTGQGYLNKAREVAESRSNKAPTLFEARQAALRAGAGMRPELSEELDEVDSDVSDKASDLGDVTAADLSKFQARYLDFERRAVVLTQLGDAQAILNGAKKDRAERLAPDTYRKAELSWKNAESVVSTNVRTPQGFQNAVAQAKSDASLLKDVMSTIKQNKDISESTALQMVSQSRQISNLKSDYSQEAAKSQQLSSELQSKSQDLTTAQASVEMQKAMEKAQAEFAPDEAEAYQQEGSLLIRLKKINFARGRSDIPEASLASLAKVSEVAKTLQASQIKVEGHTDSVGGQTLNKRLSEERATAIASYLKKNGFEDIDVESSGYGFQKPLATNKTKEGRAQNRRVDIVITPKATIVQ